MMCVSAHVMHDELLRLDECAPCCSVSLHIVCLFACLALAFDPLLLDCRKMTRQGLGRARQYAAVATESAGAAVAASPSYKEALYIAVAVGGATIFFVHKAIQQGVREMKQDMRDLKTELQGNITELRGDVTSLREDMPRILAQHEMWVRCCWFV